MNQVLANALVSASLYIVIGLGFSFIYATARFFHFAHGVVVTAGAYLTFALHVRAGLPLPVATVGGALLSGCLGIVFEVSVHRPLRSLKASPSELLIASLGTYIALQACLSLAFGAGSRSLGPREFQVLSLPFGIRITIVQLAIVLSAAGLVVGSLLFLRTTDVGRALRALASNPDLALVYGVDVDRVFVWIFFLGSVIAGLGGTLMAADTDILPVMGFRVFMMAVVAVIIGGAGNVWGLVFGAILLAIAQHLTAWWLSYRWQDAIAFVVLVVFLLVRPQGFMGKIPRKATL